MALDVCQAANRSLEDWLRALPQGPCTSSLAERERFRLVDGYPCGANQLKYAYDGT